MKPRIPSSPPLIAPLSPIEQRTMWSVMIPVYNCSQFIPAALESVLNQDLGEERMQIEVVDDRSIDADVEAMVNKLGKGRVKYFRQAQNVGSLRNFETCLNRSKGKLVHLLHGDDRVKAGFYDKFTSLFQSHPEAGAAFCRYISIDEFGNARRDSNFKETREGILINGLARIAAEQPAQFVGMVVRREVYEKLGSFYGVNYGEDYEMWTRIAKVYPIIYTPEILAEYRRHLGSISWPFTENGQNAKDLATTIKKVEAHLPKSMIWVMRKAKFSAARYCLKTSNIICNHSGNMGTAIDLVKLSMRLSKSPKLYYKLFKVSVKISINLLKINRAVKLLKKIKNGSTSGNRKMVPNN